MWEDHKPRTALIHVTNKILWDGLGYMRPLGKKAFSYLGKFKSSVREYINISAICLTYI